MHGSRLFAGPPGLMISKIRRDAPDKPYYHLILPTGPTCWELDSNHESISTVVSYHGDQASSGRSGIRFKPEVIRSGDYHPFDGLIDSVNPILPQLDSGLWSSSDDSPFLFHASRLLLFKRETMRRRWGRAGAAGHPEKRTHRCFIFIFTIPPTLSLIDLFGKNELMDSVHLYT